MRERDKKNHSSHGLSQIESSSASILQNELSVPTTDTGSSDNKYEKYLSNVSTESCERDQVHSVQDCFMVDSNMEEQLSSHFPHGNTVNSEEEMEITFQPSVYGEIGDKDINSFPNEGVLLLLFFFLHVIIQILFEFVNNKCYTKPFNSQDLIVNSPL